MSTAGVRISALVGNQASGACTMQAQHSGGVLRWFTKNQFAHVLCSHAGEDKAVE